MTTLVEKRTADQAIREHGLDGNRILKICHAVALDAQRKAPAGLGGKYEDLVSFLTLQACEAAINYNPERSSTNYTFASYLYDILEMRVRDWYRRKSEGFGDRRSGSDGRIVLAGNANHEGHSPLPGTINTWDVDPDIDFDKLVSERRLARYGNAAQSRGLPLAEWIVITLDIAARHAETHRGEGAGRG